MNISDRRGLKKEARQALERASYDPRKLILIHTGATVLLGLVLALLDYLLEQQIGGTGGLSGVKLRSILETAQSVLTVAQLLAAMFWQIGYVYVALKISRGEEIGATDLCQGFRRFGPVLRLRLITTLIYTGLTMASVYIASTVFTFTPWAKDLVAAYEAGTEEALLAAMESVAVPLVGITVVVMLLLIVPYFYRLRQAEFVLMENPRAGAMLAIHRSRELMRGRRMELFKLDLSFWWFYGLELLTLLVADGGVVLGLLGVELPWSSTASYYIFMALCYLCTLVLYWWRGNEVQVTYARAYEALKPEE